MRLESLRVVWLSAVLVLSACSSSPTPSGDDAGTPSPGGNGQPDPGTGGSVARSSRNNLRFKGAERLATDFATALSLPADQVCNELGQYPCTSYVHTVTLGGVDPYANSLYEPLTASGVTTPIAVDRVVLSACGRRVALDLATPSAAVLFKDIALDAQGRLADRGGTPVKDAITALYQRGVLRDPSDAEMSALIQLSTDIEGSGSTQPGQDWMKAACFVVLSSAESVFF
ncbi:hypothetical protein [Melittangium boletus]|uniref:Lipoprotein n=1 Tax=Melittangium boletus DSM 14713 TaxID=1294270 RepID=A0A250IR47_9BACT|nr:hypothetical protein [Melittangium boletus]ATB33732.1 hypothetical protein MEBOL_007230 [Melittangium boletus DSM 14713]